MFETIFFSYIGNPDFIPSQTKTNNMEPEIANKLKTNNLRNVGSSSGGCISSGNVYETDTGKIFVKTNDEIGADLMFDGEYQSLVALRGFDFPVPRPLCFGKNYIAVEFIEIKPLRKFMTTLGKDLANLHQNSGNSQFGFETTTCCGFRPLCNNWESDWVKFYATHRLEACIKDIQNETGNRKIGELWSNLQLIIPNFFKNITVSLF